MVRSAETLRISASIDLDRAFTQAQALAAGYRGKLAELAGKPDGSALLAEAVKAYESLRAERCARAPF